MLLKFKKKYLSAGPSITSLEKKIVLDMMNNGWDNYNYVELFEQNFAKYHNRKYCLMTPSCTSAIYLTLKTLNIKKGDEVIVPDVTWTASVSPVVEAGAKPVFIDIDIENWCINSDLVEKKINKNTKAIIAVNLFGNMPKIEDLKKICKKKKIFLLEDTAEALGTVLNQTKAGKFGDVSFHSFHRTKTITSGEGGALLTDDKKIFYKAKHLRDLGRSKKNSYIANTPSLKFMPSNLQASMAYAQFLRIKELLSIKRRMYCNYKKFLSGLDIVFNNNDQKIRNGFWAIVVIFNKKYKIKIPELKKFLLKFNIEGRDFFRPLSSQKAYKKFIKPQIAKKNKVSYELYKRALVLPSHYNLDSKDIKFISDKIKLFFKQK